MIAVAAMSACSGDLAATSEDAPAEPVAAATSAVTLAQPVRLALEVDNGVGVPLQVRAGQTFYLNQIDLRASVLASVDEGIDGLKSSGDFAALKWNGAGLADEDVALLPNPDGTFTRHRYYRDAKWMKSSSSFTLQQLDAEGREVAPSIVVEVGSDNNTKQSDSFFTRRLHAIQWAYDCASPTSCAGASHFQEEALVELRNAQVPTDSFKIVPSTTALRLSWSLQAGSGYVIPVTQIASPPYDYGFSIDLAFLTPPGPDGSYPPGSGITIQATLRDGSGNRLHPAGSLPSYLDVKFGPNPAGIQYYGAFFDPTATYYRRKHREGMMISQIIGPVQDLQPIRTPVSLGELMKEDPIDQAGTVAVDGIFSQAILFPAGSELFGGAFDPQHQAWALPVNDTWTYRLPADAKPGTYIVSMKGRRVYLGESLPFTRNVTIQVATPVPTTPPASTGNCGSCHTGGGSFGSVLHANSDLKACNGCHVPLATELDNPVYVRTHLIHSRAGGRFDAPLNHCATCHLTKESIQRTSKSACLSCHTSYPQSHVTQFGPITSFSVGGGVESFDQCSTTCHTSHPGSNLP